MAAHLYWRLNISANNGGTTIAVAELAMYTAGAASSSTTGGTASASTTTGSQTASLAFDGSVSTYWQSTGTSATLQYQFASAVDIAAYAVTSQSLTLAPLSWTLDWSDDGASWTTADTVSKQKDWGRYTATANETRYFTTGANAGGTETGTRIGAQGPTGAQSTAAAGGALQMGKAPPTAARTVSGNVKVGTTNTAGLLVRAFAKATGEYLGQATTDASGNYSINCGGYFGDVEVMAFNPTTYQALVYDQVVPG